jgi:hypothetical protein
MTTWQTIIDEAGIVHQRFLAALNDAPQAQAELLRCIIRDNCNTAFGRRHGFKAIHEAADFRSRVPISTYADYEEPITRIARGERDVLFAGAPLAFEETGGSTAGPKLIPYPAAAIHAFRAAVLPWLADLLKARPAITKGRAYWAISPAARGPRHTPSGLPIGIPDAAYLGEALAAPFAELSVAPPALTAESDLERWRFVTLCHLAAAADLSLISIWSPSFFTRLLKALHRQHETIAQALTQGLPGDRFALPADPKRAALLRAACHEDGLDTRALWPRLDTVSCWTQGAAAASAAHLQGLLEHAQMQGKGLLATESAVSIPLADFAYPVLAVSSAYFEFMDRAERSFQCHELSIGEDYRVLITTPGGLYRYDIGDRVRCRGFAGSTPLLEFLGRAGLVCDLAGEKLVEDFVAAQLPADAGFLSLVPRASGAGYALVVDAQRHDTAQAAALATAVDRALGKNPQYEYARRLGQLEALVVLRISDPAEAYQRWALARGQHLGTIKPLALHRNPEWLEAASHSATKGPVDRPKGAS